MCKVIEDLLMEERLEVRLELHKKVVKNMLKKSLSPETIADYTGIPLEEVQKIAATQEA